MLPCHIWQAPLIIVDLGICLDTHCEKYGKRSETVKRLEELCYHSNITQSDSRIRKNYCINTDYELQYEQL